MSTYIYEAYIHFSIKGNSSHRSHADILRSCHYDDEWHLTLGVEAFDPYITTQVKGIDTIACRMDDEIENPKLVLT